MYVSRTNQIQRISKHANGTKSQLMKRLKYHKKSGIDRVSSGNLETTNICLVTNENSLSCIEYIMKKATSWHYFLSDSEIDACIYKKRDIGAKRDH